MWILTLAAWSRREQVTKAINSGEPRPLAYQPDWLIGWAMLRYANDKAPGARRLYTAAVGEWRRRKEPKDNKDVRWRAIFSGIDRADCLDGLVVTDWVDVAGGCWTYIGHSMMPAGNDFFIIMDVPAGIEPVPLDARVTVQRDSAAGP